MLNRSVIRIAGRRWVVDPDRPRSWAGPWLRAVVVPYALFVGSLLGFVATLCVVAVVGEAMPVTTLLVALGAAMALNLIGAALLPSPFYEDRLPRWVDPCGRLHQLAPFDVISVASSGDPNAPRIKRDYPSHRARLMLDADRSLIGSDLHRALWDVARNEQTLLVLWEAYTERWAPELVDLTMAYADRGARAVALLVEVMAETDRA